MGSKTKISWTDATWNPVTGCSWASAGCDNCYAEMTARRFSWNIKNEPLYYAGVINPKTMRWNGKVTQKIPKFNPLTAKRPRNIFVCSMGDLFHDSVPDAWIYEVMRVIMNTPQHRYMILTKRPERMQSYFAKRCSIKNLALGVSVENQETADKRIPILLQTTAAKRFISIEPMLGPVDLNAMEYLIDKKRFSLTIGNYLDLVILGGESGPKARPMNPDWARLVRDQCFDSNVPFHFKQWGEWCECQQAEKEIDCENIPYRYFSGQTEPVFRCGVKIAGRKIDGFECNGTIDWDE
jgi:protein gp37